MKCLSCGLEFTDELAKCPRCGFPVIGIVDDTEESREHVMKLADEYRKKHWTFPEVYLEVYSNKIENDKIITEKKELILLGETKEFPTGEIKWNSEKFARLSGECNLNIVIRQKGENDRTLSLSVPNPGTSSFWQVGLMKKTDDLYCIVVGSKSKYTESNPFDVFNK